MDQRTRLGHSERAPADPTRPSRAAEPATSVPRLGGAPGQLVHMLGRADAATRAGMLTDLQRRYGNATVARLLDSHTAPPVPVQRWAVDLPAETASCNAVVDWMNANSPYRDDSGWAKTFAEFNWESDGFSYRGAPPGMTVRAINPRVSLEKSVDMPSWSPSAPAMQTAWGNMTTALRTHEAAHERIASQWQLRLQQRLARGVPTPSRAAGPDRIQSAYAGWIGDHQAAQTRIDPYTATLLCPGETAPAPSPAPQPPVSLEGLEGEADLSG